jgi:teichoic acid transport system ATP-binding protein
MGMVKRFCTEAVLLHKGRVVTSGDPEEVVDHYQELTARSQEQKGAETSERDRQLDYEIEHEDEDDTPTSGVGAGADVSTANGGRRTEKVRGVTGEVEILGLELLNEQGQPVDKLPSGTSLTVRVRLRYNEAVEDSTLGITLQSKRAGLEIFATNTALEGVPLGRKNVGEQATVDFTFGVPLRSGVYTVNAAVTAMRVEDSDLARTQTAATFKVTHNGGQNPVRGLVQLPTEVRIHDGLEGWQERAGRPA